MSSNEYYPHLAFRIPSWYNKIRSDLEGYAAKKNHLVTYYTDEIVIINLNKCGKDISWTYEYEKLLKGVQLYMSTDEQLSSPSEKFTIHLQ